MICNSRFMEWGQIVENLQAQPQLPTPQNVTVPCQRVGGVALGRHQPAGRQNFRLLAPLRRPPIAAKGEISHHEIRKAKVQFGCTIRVRPLTCATSAARIISRLTPPLKLDGPNGTWARSLHIRWLVRPSPKALALVRRLDLVDLIRSWHWQVPLKAHVKLPIHEAIRFK
jgi:hypothetical protein